jgi:hypothetical protein
LEAAAWFSRTFAKKMCVKKSALQKKSWGTIGELLNLAWRIWTGQKIVGSSFCWEHMLSLVNLFTNFYFNPCRREYLFIFLI